jgi:hypothetical protein
MQRVVKAGEGGMGKSGRERSPLRNKPVWYPYRADLAAPGKKLGAAAVNVNNTR